MDNTHPKRKPISVAKRTPYHTGWIKESALSLKLDGLNTDQAYENFVRQIAGEMFSGTGETLKESMERDEHRKEL